MSNTMEGKRKFYCKFPNCKSCYKMKVKNKHFYHFPKDPQVLQKWMDACQMTNATYRPCYVVCEDHFSECDFMNVRKVRLVPSAVPSGPSVSSNSAHGDLSADQLEMAKRNRCYVAECREAGSHGAKTHRLPQESEFRNEWLRWLGLEQPLLPDEQLYQKVRICDVHFASHFKVPGTKRGLRRDAVPTIRFDPMLRPFIPVTASLQASTSVNDNTDVAQPTISISASTSVNDNTDVAQAKISILASTSVNDNTDVAQATSEIISEVKNTSSVSSSSGIGYEDFDKICRICLKHSPNLQPICVQSHPWKYIASSAAIEVSVNNGLPRNMCDGCKATLEQICAFINKIKCSNQYLRNVKEKTIGKEKSLENGGSSIGTESFATGHQLNPPDVNAHSDEILLDLEEKPLDTDTNVCMECDKSFDTQKQLNRHVKTHSTDHRRCEKCGKIYSNWCNMRKHLLRKHSENIIKPHKCPYCVQAFDLRAGLVRHLRTHSGERPFGCDVCHKSYPSKSYLHKHKKIHEPVREKRFICEYCSKSFAVMASLSSHLTTHSGIRPFKCGQCDKFFRTNGSLKSHIRHIHIKEKNFMCQVCGKLYTTSSAVNHHLRRHAGEAKATASYDCSLCFKKLSTAAYLKLHVRAVHAGERPYSCDLCTKKFASTNALKVHRMYHTGEKPFACSFCEKTFVTNGNRRVHERVHTQEKPYKCSLCGTRFSQSGTLRIHMKSHDTK